MTNYERAEQIANGLGIRPAPDNSPSPLVLENREAEFDGWRMEAAPGSCPAWVMIYVYAPDGTCRRESFYRGVIANIEDWLLDASASDVKLKIGPWKANGHRVIYARGREFVERKVCSGRQVAEVRDSELLPVGCYRYSYEAHKAIRREVAK